MITILFNYVCGAETDGCYEDNLCFDYGYNTRCSCKGLPEACDEISYITQIQTTQFVTTSNHNQQSALDSKIEIIIFIAIAIGGCCCIIFILLCVWKARRKGTLYRYVSREYKIENGTLNSKLLADHTLSNVVLNKNDEGNKETTKHGATNKTKQIENVSYDDNAELGSYKMIPEAELGDNLFNGVVVDDDDDY